MRSLSRFVLGICAVGLFGIAVYRAATQALTIDEAATFLNYVQGGLAGILNGPFDANNHVLYSLLELACYQVAGMAEWVLRAPALLGAGLFLYATAALILRLVPGFWWRLLAFLVVAGNPITMDFAVAARGYALALGLFAMALLQWFLWFENPGRGWRIALASALLGLATAANLNFTFYAIACTCLGVLVLLVRCRFVLAVLATVIGPAVSVALWWLPFQNFNRGQLYFGTPNIPDAIWSLAAFTFVHDNHRGDPFGNWTALYHFRAEVLPFLIFLAVAEAAVWLWRRKGEPPLVFLTLITAVSCFGLWLAHAWLEILYPSQRTGLPLIFLFLLVQAAAGARHWNGGSAVERWALGLPALVLQLLFLAQFAGQFDPSYFAEWREQRELRQVMARMRDVHGRVRTHWVYQASAEYYRQLWHLDCPPIDREADEFDYKDAVYVVLPAESREKLQSYGRPVVYWDRDTGVALLGR